MTASEVIRYLQRAYVRARTYVSATLSCDKPNEKSTNFLRSDELSKTSKEIVVEVKSSIDIDNYRKLEGRLISSIWKVSACPTNVNVKMSSFEAVSLQNNLLCHEQFESGKLNLEKENVTVVPFLSECVWKLYEQARECGVTITLVTDQSKIDSDLVLSYALQPLDSIFVDKIKMDHVIRGLMSNALKFTPRGGGLTVVATFVPDAYTEPETVKVRRPSMISRMRDYVTDAVTVFKKTPLPAIPHQVSLSDGIDVPLVGKLLIVVTDTGAAISTENQKRLFKDIGQLSPEKLQAGGDSGLGMWITGGIVDLHGGKISVYSEGGGSGSEFTVELPMKRVSLVSELSMMNLAPDDDPDTIELSVGVLSEKLGTITTE